MSAIVVRIRGNADRIKLVLIPVLAAVLLYVVLRSNNGDPLVSSAAALASPDEPARSLLGAKPATSTPLANWPEYRLEDVLPFNPFDPSPGADGNDAPKGPTTAERPPDPVPTRPAAKQRLPNVNAIYESVGQRVAIVEARLVRVGDTVAGGRVVEITDSEVVIEPR